MSERSAERNAFEQQSSAPLDGVRRELAPLRGMVRAQLLDHPSAQDAAEALCRKLDFR